MLTVAGGEETVKVSGKDESTVTLGAPGEATSGADIWAMSLVLLSNVVGRLLVFHLATELGVKLAPSTIRRKSALPAVVEEGFKLVIAGVALTDTNSAPTYLLASIVTTHSSFPKQAPDQPTKVEIGSPVISEKAGVAVNVTCSP